MVNDVTKQFVHLFNVEQDFYECHEIFEAAWKASSDPMEAMFYKSLVQVATAQFKLRKGALRGVHKLYGYCKRALDALPSYYMGIDIGRLRLEFKHQIDQLPDGVEELTDCEYARYGLHFLTIHAVDE